MTELKPCPFCRSAKLAEFKPVGEEWRVRCLDCDAEAKEENWNTRAANDESSQ